MRAARQKQEQIICRKSGLAVILLLVELARSCSLFVNLKERGERKEVKRGEGGKKSGFDSSMKDSRDTNDVLRTERDIPDSCCEFQTRPSVAATPQIPVGHIDGHLRNNHLNRSPLMAS